MVDTHHSSEGGLFFLYGSSGIRKTYPWNTIISKFRYDKPIVLAIASLGIASLLLPEGKTALQYRYNLMRCQFVSLIRSLNMRS